MLSYIKLKNEETEKNTWCWNLREIRNQNLESTKQKKIMYVPMYILWLLHFYWISVSFPLNSPQGWQSIAMKNTKHGFILPEYVDRQYPTGIL